MKPSAEAEVVFKRDSVNVTGAMRGMLAAFDVIYDVLTQGRVPEERSLNCPECGSYKVNTIWTTKTSEVNGYPDLSTVVPSRVCKECDCGFLDWQGEAIWDAALLEHFERHKSCLPNRSEASVRAVLGDAISSPTSPWQDNEISTELGRIEYLIESMRQEPHSPVENSLVAAVLGLINLMRRQHNIPYGTIVTGTPEAGHGG